MADNLKEMAVTLLATVGAKEPSVRRDSERVTLLAANLARELGLPPDDVEAIWLAAMVHDIGMVALPRNVLRKKDILTDEEWTLVQSHVRIGADVLKGSVFPGAIASIAAQHHERLDGSGYPQGLKGYDVSPAGRILAVADVFDAMTSVRPYRPALLVEEARGFLDQHKGVLFAPEVVQALPSALTRMGLVLR